MSQNTQDLDMAVMAKFMKNFIGFDGDQEEFCKQMEDFREAIIEIARDTQKIPESGIESFVDSQILALWNFIECVQKFPGRYAPPEFNTKEKSEIERLVTSMMDDTEVNDFSDTKPYTDHWGGMTDKNLRDLACRIYRYLKLKYNNGRREWHGLSLKDRLDDLNLLALRCKGTVYAMFKPTLFDECMRDPRGMHIRFVDNQKNNRNKKIESIKRKIAEAEAEAPDEATNSGRRRKRRGNKKKAKDRDEVLEIPPEEDHPAKPIARKGGVVPKDQKPSKGLVRGPRFRVDQENAKANKSLTGSQSAAQPLAAEAPHSDVSTGDSATPRDAARAVAQGLAVEAPRAGARQEYGEPEVGSSKRDRQECGEPEVASSKRDRQEYGGLGIRVHKRARTSAVQQGFAGNQERNSGRADSTSYHPDNSFAIGQINTPNEQLHGPAGSYYDDRSGFPGYSAQFAPPSANIQHVPFQVTSNGVILVTPGMDTLRQELGMGATDYGMPVPHIAGQDAFFQNPYNAGGSSSAQPQSTYWDGAFETGGHQRGTLPATGGNPQAPVSYPVAIYQDFDVDSLLGGAPPPPEFTSGRAAVPRLGRATEATNGINSGPAGNAVLPLRYLKTALSFVGGGQEADSGIEGTSDERAEDTAQPPDPPSANPAADPYDIYGPDATSASIDAEWAAEWDSKPWADDSEWEDPSGFDQGAKLEPIGPLYSITPTPPPRFDNGKEEDLMDTMSKLDDPINKLTDSKPA